MTFWTFQVLEINSRTTPSFLDLLFNTGKMKDISTIKHNAGLLTKASGLANAAYVSFTILQLSLFRHSFKAFRLEAREAYLLSNDAIAWMSTIVMHFVTRFLHKIKALALPADFSEGRFHTRRWLLELFRAKSAYSRFNIFTNCAVRVIWF